MRSSKKDFKKTIDYVKKGKNKGNGSRELFSVHISVMDGYNIHSDKLGKQIFGNTNFLTAVEGYLQTVKETCTKIA